MKKCGLLLLMLFPLGLFAQILSGSLVEEDSSLAIAQSWIQIYDTANPNEVLQFVQTNANGEFQIDLTPIITKNQIKSIRLLIQKLGYIVIDETIEITGKDIQLDYLMQKDAVELNPVKVVGKATPIVAKKDTVVYDVERHKTGTELVIEDVLKNMPGIEINPETGLITYNQTPVETVLLDGDNIFDRNYTVGTRNINADLVAKVEAISNWSEKSILKGVEDSQKVALNLKLQKNVAVINPSGTLAYGIENKLMLRGNAVTLSARHKNVSSGMYNNLGKNLSPYNYFIQYLARDQEGLSPYFANQLLDRTTYQGSVNSNRARQGRQTFASINQMFKISENLNLRLIGSFLNENLFQDKFSSYEYWSTNDETLNRTTQDNLQIQPITWNSQLNLTWNKSKKELWEWKTIWLDEKLDTHNVSVINNQENQTQLLANKNYFLRNQISYTKRVNDGLAYEIDAAYTGNAAPQNLLLNPTVNFELDELTSGNMNQFSRIEKNTAELNLSILAKTKKEKKYQINFNSILANNFLKSQLSQTDFQNDLKYQEWLNGIQMNYGFLLWNLQVNPSVTLNWYQIHLENYVQNTDYQFNKLTYNQQISLTKQIDSSKNLSFISVYQQSPVSISQLFTEPILDQDRTLISNEYNFSFQKSWLNTLSFTLNNLYGFSKTQVKLSYMTNQNRYFTEIEFIGENYLQLKSFPFPESVSSYMADVFHEKFLAFLSSTAKFRVNYRQTHYIIKLQNQELSAAISRQTQFSFSLKSAFDIPLNFANIASYSYRNSKIENQNNFYNSTFSNKATLYFKPRKTWSSAVTLDYINPSLKYQNDIYFLDFQIRYKPQNSNFSFRLEGENLLGNTYFNQYLINDFYTILSRESLNRRFVILALDFQF